MQFPINCPRIASVAINEKLATQGRRQRGGGCRPNNFEKKIKLINNKNLTLKVLIYEWDGECYMYRK